MSTSSIYLPRTQITQLEKEVCLLEGQLIGTRLEVESLAKQMIELKAEYEKLAQVVKKDERQSLAKRIPAVISGAFKLHRAEKRRSYSSDDN